MFVGLDVLFYSRATLHVHGAHLHTAPAHSLQRGVVITQLRTATQEVFLLVDHHAAALMSLRTQKLHHTHCIKATYLTIEMLEIHPVY